MTSTVDDQQPTRTRTGLGRLLASTGVSLFGQGMVAAAAPLLAATLTRNPLAVSAVTAAIYAANLVIGLPAGALVDRWSRRTTMVIADLIRALILLGLTVAVWTGHASIGLLIACVFCIGAAGCFFDPAAQAAIPALIGRDPDGLARANGRLWALDVLGRSLAGPPIGAALFVVAAAIPFGGNAVTFAASALLLVGLRGLAQPPDTTTATTPSLRSDIAHGVRYLFGHRDLRALTIGMGSYNLGFNIAYGTLVLYVQHVLGLRDIAFGILLAMLALGGVAGGWIGPKLTTRLGIRTIYGLALLMQAAAWAAIAITGNVIVAGIALIGVGIASTTVSVTGGTVRQRLTPDHLLGRITAGTRVIGIGAAAIGALIGGAIADTTSLTTSMVVGAAVAVLAAAGFLARARRTT